MQERLQKFLASKGVASRRESEKIISAGRVFVNGKKVITSDAYTVGEVDGAEVDTDIWTIPHLQVSLSSEATKELGFKKPFMGSVKVCIPTSSINRFGDVITLLKSLKELKELPECKASQ